MAALIRFKRGDETRLNTVSLSGGEPAFTLDTQKFFIGDGTGLKIEIGNNTVGPVTTLVRANSASWGNVYTVRSTEQRVVTCYKDALMGSYSFADSYNKTKFLYLSEDPTSSITLTLCAIAINGRKLPMFDNAARITIDGASLTYSEPPVGYRTPGGNVYVNNYVNFVNNIFSSYNIDTNIWGGFRNGDPTRFRLYARHNSYDDFNLIFEEKYNNIGEPIPGRSPVEAQYFILKTTDYWTLADTANTSYESVIFPEPLTTLVMRAWSPRRL